MSRMWRNPKAARPVSEEVQPPIGGHRPFNMQREMDGPKPICRVLSDVEPSEGSLIPLTLGECSDWSSATGPGPSPASQISPNGWGHRVGCPHRTARTSNPPPSEHVSVCDRFSIRYARVDFWLPLPARCLRSSRSSQDPRGSGKPHDHGMHSLLLLLYALRAGS